MQTHKKSTFLYILAGVVFVIVLVFIIPPLRVRVLARLDLLRASVAYALFPPEKEVFLPRGELTAVAQKTAQALTPSSTPLSTKTPVPIPPTPEHTLTPTLTPTPLPADVVLRGVRYMDQHYGWNNCAPANLAMLLSYWGWTGTAQDTSKVLKPFEEDKNVMPYELADYVTGQTELGVVMRYGGTLDLLKRLLANNFPVLLEAGTYRLRETTTGKFSFMGHYTLLTGYNDATGQFLVQDSYVGPDQRLPYEVVESEWRSFNYVFLVAYSKDREVELLNLLGDYADYNQSVNIAAETASREIYSLEGLDQVFAWFNRGTSLMLLQDYFGAADAYDQAFSASAQLEDIKRPYRLPWYQTGPYFAYYYSGRYQDVIDLADQTLEPLLRTGKPYLEETYYWRARAYLAVGQRDLGIQDLCTSLQVHPDFNPSTAELESQGATCP